MQDGGKLQTRRNLPMVLLRARESMMSHFRPILRAHDITEQQWRVIRALHRSESLGQGGFEVTALAEKTLLLMPSLTRILKSLEEQKFIKRYAVEGDNRRKLIRLADPGRELYNKMAPLSEAEYKKIEARIGQDRLMELYALLDAIEN